MPADESYVRASARWSSAGRCEKFQSDVVGIAEGQPRAVAGVHDAAVGDAQLAQPSLPLVEVASAGAREGYVIEAYPSFVERLRAPIGELVQAHQGGPHRPHHMTERTGVLVEDRLGVEQPLVPR